MAQNMDYQLVQNVGFAQKSFIIFHKKGWRMLSFFSVFTRYTNPACGGKLYEKSLNVIFPVKV